MPRVLVGMSGGVDSSMTAKILIEKGYEVEGATMWLGEHSNKIISRAKEIAGTLNINHHVVDLSKIFKYNIIEEFKHDYSKGETPIPCAKCNKEVKFGAFLDYANDMGFDFVATGHYIIARKDENGEIGIYRPKDASKDQTHFLFWVDRKKFSRMLFPLGEYIKKDIKEISKELNIGLDSQAESQDVCFLEGKSYVDFFNKQDLEFKKDLFLEGDIIKYPENIVVGRHQGIIRYTIGQRRNIGISFPKPLYVLKTDKEKNQVVVCEEEFLYEKKFFIKNVNLNSLQILNKTNLSLKVATRAMKKAINANLKIDYTNQDNIIAEIDLEHGERAITIGQACVFYDLKDERMLGGGIISSYQNNLY